MTSAINATLSPAQGSMGRSILNPAGMSAPGNTQGPMPMTFISLLGMAENVNSTLAPLPPPANSSLSLSSSESDFLNFSLPDSTSQSQMVSQTTNIPMHTGGYQSAPGSVATTPIFGPVMPASTDAVVMMSLMQNEQLRQQNEFLHAQIQLLHKQQEELAAKQQQQQLIVQTNVKGTKGKSGSGDSNAGDGGDNGEQTTQATIAPKRYSLPVPPSQDSFRKTPPMQPVDRRFSLIGTPHQSPLIQPSPALYPQFISPMLAPTEMSPSPMFIAHMPNQIAPLALPPPFQQPIAKGDRKPGIRPNVPAPVELESKSNYQAIIEGQASLLGFGEDVVKGVEERRSTHKSSEKRRREDLKCGFQHLRSMVPALNQPNNKSQQYSKATIIKKAGEYLWHLHRERESIIEEISRLKRENKQLKGCKSQPRQLPSLPINPPPQPTEESPRLGSCSSISGDSDLLCKEEEDQDNNME